MVQNNDPPGVGLIRMLNGTVVAFAQGRASQVHGSQAPQPAHGIQLTSSQPASDRTRSEQLTLAQLEGTQQRAELDESGFIRKFKRTPFEPLQTSLTLPH